MVFVETWLNCEIKDSELDLTNYDIYRADRNSEFIDRSRGGGVMICCGSELKSNVICCVSNWFDLLIVRVTTEMCSFIICSVYMPPQSNLEKYENLCRIIEDNIEAFPDLKIWVFGDFNVPDWSENDDCQQAISNCQFLISNTAAVLGLHQVNHVTNVNTRYLDLVFTNENNFDLSRDTDPLLPVDVYHPPLSVSFNGKIEQLQYLEERKNYKKANIHAICESLNLVDWEMLFNRYCNNVNECVEAFYQCLYGVFDKYVPSYTFKPSRFPKWFSVQLQNLVYAKKIAHKKFKQSGSQEDFESFVSLRSLCKERSKSDYDLFLSRAESNIKTNSRFFWQHVKNLSSDKGLPSEMSLNDRTVNTPEDIAEAFCDYFSENYVNSSGQGLNDAEQDSPGVLHINRCSIKLSDVFATLENLDVKKSAGPDDIPPFIINACRFSLAKPLFLIFNKSLADGCFPEVWKRGKVIPVHKNGKKSDVTNYRPIVIISQFAKVFELLVYKEISPLCLKFMIPEQHGFMKSKSTLSNLLSFEHYLLECLQSNVQVDVIYTDFVKAFDRISHVVLLQRLKSFGFDGTLLLWFQDYLRDRTQVVKVGNAFSRQIIVPSGAPQGGHLSPLFFSVFVNKLNIIFDEDIMFWLFADDLKYAKVIRNADDCLDLQRNIDKFCNWCSSHDLQLNVKKCQFVRFSRKKEMIDYPYSINGEVLREDSVVKDLGIYVDNKLRFDTHMKNTCSKAMSTLGFVKRHSSSFEADTVKLLYMTLVRPILEYNTPVWCPHYNCDISLVESVQRKFVRYYCYKVGIDRDEHSYHELLPVFSLESLQKRRFSFDVITVQKILQNKIEDSYLLGSLHLSVNQITRSNHVFKIPFCSTDTIKYNGLFRIMASVNLANSHANVDLFFESMNVVKKKLENVVL